VLQPVGEEVGNPLLSVGSIENAGIPRVLATTQLDISAAPTILAGRKCSVTSSASGSGRRGPSPRHLASAADFSPTHSDEPIREVGILSLAFTFSH
jgi:hypothetical protein